LAVVSAIRGRGFMEVTVFMDRTGCYSNRRDVDVIRGMYMRLGAEDQIMSC